MTDKLREAQSSISELLEIVERISDKRTYRAVKARARAALAAAPQTAPAPADERAAMIDVIEKALPWIVPCPELVAPKIADALLAAGWTRGGDAAPHVIETQETEHDGENVLTPATQRRARQMSIFPDSSRPSAPETPHGG